MKSIKRPWKPFKIDLQSMYLTIQLHIEDFDGISANEEGLEIFKLTEVTEYDEAVVDTYLRGITEEGEALKIDRPIRVEHAINSCKIKMLTKTYDQMEDYEKKLILGLPLTELEIDQILANE